MSSEPLSSTDLYAQVEAYPWDTDAEFQGGLSAILGSSPSPEQAAELALRARCFYFARKFSTYVDFDAYKAYRASHSLPPPSTQPSQYLPNGANVTSMSEAPSTSQYAPAPPSGTPEDAPYPTSFQEIVDLITSGKPIPGIKEIPNTILEGQGTQATKGKRRKPWEKDGLPANAATFSATSSGDT